MIKWKHSTITKPDEVPWWLSLQVAKLWQIYEGGRYLRSSAAVEFISAPSLNANKTLNLDDWKTKFNNNKTPPLDRNGLQTTCERKSETTTGRWGGNSDTLSYYVSHPSWETMKRRCCCGIPTMV